MRWELFFLNPAVVWVLIPIAAILTTGIQQLVKMYFRHRERIALIEQGIHPDLAGVDESGAPSDAVSGTSHSPANDDWRLRTTQGRAT